MNDYAIQTYLHGLVHLFADRCEEKSTIEELRELLSDEDRWVEAYSLFDRIRRKTLDAEKDENWLLAHQYVFEEICAKTIFNLTNPDAPFDADSPFFVIPIALSFARALGIADEEVIRIIAHQSRQHRFSGHTAARRQNN